MYNKTDLLNNEGLTAPIYARNVAQILWGDSELCLKRISDDLRSKEAKQSDRERMSSKEDLAKIELLKSKFF